MVCSMRVLKAVPFRQAFVIATDPMRIISWDTTRTALQVVSMPSDILISGAFGYGQYALSAIQTLDTLDHKNGMLLSQSVSQAVGMPITGAIFTKSFPPDTPVLDTLKRHFSWRSIGQRLVGRVGTTVSFSDWIHIVLLVHTLGTDDVEVLNLATAVTQMSRPDGVTVRVLDPQKVDYILGNSFHDTKLRNENKTVTIINTTTVFGIGSHIARMVNRFGIQVVSVGNQTEQIDNCQLETDKKTKNSLTYQFLKAYFRCSETLGLGESEVSDITLRLGTRVGAMFVSIEK
mgnify:FL=1